MRSVTVGPATTYYTYDQVGNILSHGYSATSPEYTYTYDILNRLSTASFYGQNYSYTYDNNGNILTAVENGVTNTYTYGDSTWKDLLTAYNGQAITYDAIGNPLTYYDGSTMTWQNGRQLQQIVKGGSSHHYVYNADGGRSGKSTSQLGDGTTITYFYYVDGVLYAQTDHTNNLFFLYDDKGTPYGVRCNNNTYYYEYNLQGDVTGIYNSVGTKVAQYTYDPWGKVLAANNYGGETIGTINPIRYRGYYYDAETGLYYCNSRYYDPETGRWLNADNIVAGVGNTTQGYNLFAYCFNNPVNLDDTTGHWPKWVEKIGEAIKQGVKKVVNAVTTVISKVQADVNNFDIKNTSEKKVLDSNYVSAYKGKVVVRTNLERSGSLGMLFISKKASERSALEDEVRHEYGHTVQLDKLGLAKYLVCIGIPSALEWGSDPSYYRRPWEITADIYGEVQSRSYPEYEDAGFQYLENSKHYGIFVWLTIE